MIVWFITELTPLSLASKNSTPVQRVPPSRSRVKRMGASSVPLNRMEAFPTVIPVFGMNWITTPASITWEPEVKLMSLVTM